MNKFLDFLNEDNLEDEIDKLRRKDKISGKDADDTFKYAADAADKKTKGALVKGGFYLYFVVYPAPQGSFPVLYVGIKSDSNFQAINFWGSIRFDGKEHYLLNRRFWESHFIDSNAQRSIELHKPGSSYSKLYMSSAGKHSDANSLAHALALGLRKLRWHPIIMNFSTLKNIRKLDNFDETTPILATPPEAKKKNKFGKDEYAYRVYVVPDFNKFKEEIKKIHSHVDSQMKEHPGADDRVLKTLADIKDDPDFREKIEEIFSDAVITNIQVRAEGFFGRKKMRVPSVFKTEENYRYYINQKIKKFPFLLIAAVEKYVTQEKDKKGDKTQGPGTAEFFKSTTLFNQFYIPSTTEMGMTQRDKEQIKGELVKELMQKKDAFELPKRTSIKNDHWTDYEGNLEHSKNIKNPSIDNILKKAGRGNHFEVASRLSFSPFQELARSSGREFSKTEGKKILASPMHNEVVRFLAGETSRGTKKVPSQFISSIRRLHDYFENAELKLLNRYFPRVKLTDLYYSFTESTKEDEKVFLMLSGNFDNEEERKKAIQKNPRLRNSEKWDAVEIEEQDLISPRKRREWVETLNPLNLSTFLDKLNYEVSAGDTVESFYKRFLESGKKKPSSKNPVGPSQESLFDDTNFFSNIIDNLLLEKKSSVLDLIFNKYMPDKYKKYYKKDLKEFRMSTERLSNPKDKIKLVIQKHLSSIKDKWDKIGFEFYLKTMMAPKLPYGAYFFEDMNGNVKKVTGEQMQKILKNLGGYDLINKQTS